MNRAKNKITSTNVNTSSVFITHHPSMYFRKANIRHPLTFFRLYIYLTIKKQKWARRETAVNEKSI